MNLFDFSLLLSTLLCSLVTGFLFAYAVVIMPGIKSLDDAQFLRVFQVTDRVIQDNHPLFMLVWVGSAISLLLCAVLGFGRLQGLDLGLLLGATAIYLFGVQASTIRIHLPLNNALQVLQLETLSETGLREARNKFEDRWNRSNRIRTMLACCTSALLIVLVFRL